MLYYFEQLWIFYASSLLYVVDLEENVCSLSAGTFGHQLEGLDEFLETNCPVFYAIELDEDYFSD